MNDQALIIDIKSKFASFRKVDSNSSSLTYHFPPRPTIMGIFAAILGLEKDSYYETFKDSKIAIKILSPGRTIFQSVNNIKILNRSQLNFLEYKNDLVHTIIPTELLVPMDFHKNLEFRIYFSGVDKLFQDILKTLEKDETAYPISLGYANMLSKVKLIGRTNLASISNDKNRIEIVTPIPAEKVDSLDISKNEKYGELKILKDLIPISVFSGRFFRNKNYIFEESGKPLNVNLKDLDNVYSVFYELNGNNYKENLCLL